MTDSTDQRRSGRVALVTDEPWESYVGTPLPSYIAPIVAWLCGDQACEVSGQVFHAVGNTIGRWTSYEQDRVIDRGDHANAPPWTLDELDRPVPTALLGGH